MPHKETHLLKLVPSIAEQVKNGHFNDSALNLISSMETECSGKSDLFAINKIGVDGLRLA